MLRALVTLLVCLLPLVSAFSPQAGALAACRSAVRVRDARAAHQASGLAGCRHLINGEQLGPGVHRVPCAPNRV